MIFDLHVHSLHGSRDSVVSLEQLAAEARAVELDGMALVEHDEPWEPAELARLSAELGVLFIPAREVQSDMGHVIAFGLSAESWRITKLDELRQEADDVGGYLVSAHPFRYLHDTSRARPSFLLEDPAKRPASVEEAASYPVFQLVDAVEAVNAHNKEEEERLRLGNRASSQFTSDRRKRRSQPRLAGRRGDGVSKRGKGRRRLGASSEERRLLSGHRAEAGPLDTVWQGRGRVMVATLWDSGPVLDRVYVSLDLETTGLDVERDVIIQVGAVKFRGEEVLDTFDHLVNPYRLLPNFITQLTGITQPDVDEAAPWPEVAGAAARLSGRPPAGGTQHIVRPGDALQSGAQPDQRQVRHARPGHGVHTESHGVFADGAGAVPRHFTQEAAPGAGGRDHLPPAVHCAAGKGDGYG